jgi:hypothetical protein
MVICFRRARPGKTFHATFVEKPLNPYPNSSRQDIMIIITTIVHFDPKYKGKRRGNNNHAKNRFVIKLENPSATRGYPHKHLPS